MRFAILFYAFFIQLNTEKPARLIEIYKSNKTKYYIPHSYEISHDIYPGQFSCVISKDSIRIKFELENLLRLNRDYHIMKVKETLIPSHNNKKNVRRLFKKEEDMFSVQLKDTTFVKSFLLKNNEYIVISDENRSIYLLDFE